MTCVIPQMLPRSSFGWHLVRTLLSVISDGNLHEGNNDVIIDGSCDAVASQLRKLAGVWSIMKNPPKIPRIASDVVNDVLKALCITKSKGGVNLADVARAVANAVEDRNYCGGRAWSPIRSSALCRAEFYKYVKTPWLGKVEGVKLLRVPAAEQGLAMIAYTYTRQAIPGKANEGYHLLLTQYNLNGVNEGYRLVFDELGTYLAALNSVGGLSWRVLQVGSAARLATSLTRSPISRRDVFALARVSKGNTFTVSSYDPIPLAGMVLFIETVSGSTNLRKAFSFRFDALLGMLGNKFKVRILDAKSRNRKSQDKLKRQTASLLNSYSIKLALYVETGSRDLIYDAARTAAGFASTDLARKAYIQLDKQGKQGLSVAEAALTLSHFASMAAKVDWKSMLAKALLEVII